MEKVVIFAFQESEMCLRHAFLYLKELNENGVYARAVIEGKATLACAVFEERKNPLWVEIKSLGYIDCICKACAKATFAYDNLQSAGVLFSDELSGHPSIYRYIKEGYKIITL